MSEQARTNQATDRDAYITQLQQRILELERALAAFAVQEGVPSFTVTVYREDHVLVSTVTPYTGGGIVRMRELSAELRYSAANDGQTL